jgi:anti-anti-sigma regulatory factor
VLAARPSSTSTLSMMASQIASISPEMIVHVRGVDFADSVSMRVLAYLIKESLTRA